MHIFPAMLCGLAIWFATLAFADNTLAVLMAGPVIVSGVMLVLVVLPEFGAARPWSSAATAMIGLALGGLVWSLFHL